MDENINLNSKTRFSNRVENYVKYRPHYPGQVISFLSKECGLTRQSIVADIGSGTGISSELFVENGNTVFAVEPNKDMRAAAENIFAGKKNFVSIDGNAEETTLHKNSADMIISGQAFHWFDKTNCKIEFKRILKDNGFVVLMWNLRDRKSKFMDEYEDIIIKYGRDYAKLYQNDVDSEEIAEFFAPVIDKIKIFYNSQLLNYEALEGRMLSSSYIPLKDENPQYDQMIDELKNIFEKNKNDEKVKMEYETKMYYGKLG